MSPLAFGFALSGALVLCYGVFKVVFRHRPALAYGAIVTLILAVPMIDLMDIRPVYSTVDEIFRSDGQTSFKPLPGTGFWHLEKDVPVETTFRIGQNASMFEYFWTYYQLRQHLSGSTLVVDNIENIDEKFALLGRFNIEKGLKPCVQKNSEQERARSRGAIKLPAGYGDMITNHQLLAGPVYSGKIYMIGRTNMTKPTTFALYNDPVFHVNIFLLVPMAEYEKACHV